MTKVRVEPIRVVLIDDIAPARESLVAIHQNAKRNQVLGTGEYGIPRPVVPRNIVDKILSTAQTTTALGQIVQQNGGEASNDG